jgi:hypothetical protein
VRLFEGDGPTRLNDHPPRVFAQGTAASLGQDWPTAQLKDLLEAHGFRILERDRRRSGPSPWRREFSTGRSVYDPQGTWTETHYTIRRSVICEACNQAFGYSFHVVQISRVHRVGHSTDGALRRELGRQLRRRLRCTTCRAVQKEPRRTLLREDWAQTGLGCGLALSGVVLVAGLGALGGWVAGIPGFFVGLLLGLAMAVGFWLLGFDHLLGIGPDV